MTRANVTSRTSATANATRIGVLTLKAEVLDSRALVMRRSVLTGRLARAQIGSVRDPDSGMRVRLKQVALVAVAPIRVPARHIARAICGDPLATGFRLTIVIWVGRKRAGCRRLPPFVLVHEERHVRRHVFEKPSSNARSSRVLVAPDDAAEAAPLVRRDDQFDPSRHPIRLLEGDLEALRARSGLCPCVQVGDKSLPSRRVSALTEPGSAPSIHPCAAWLLP